MELITHHGESDYVDVSKLTRWLSPVRWPES